MINLKGKHAIVCGSSQGIGKATAEVMAGLGCRITLFARNKKALQSTLDGLDNSAGQKHAFITADFSNRDDISETIESYVSGLDEAHILVNNTGGPPPGLAIDAQPDDFLKAFTAHLIGNQIITQALVPLMKEQGYGRIINIISTSVKTPIAGLGVSNTTRGAVASWSKTLARELGPFGITVNNVLPGFTMTGRLESLFRHRAENQGITYEEYTTSVEKTIPARRFAEASEVANAVAFLASEEAAYINGINLPVDGGNTPAL